MTTHAVDLRCQGLPLVHDACHHLTQSRQRRAGIVLAIPLYHGTEVALELYIRFARPRWVVLAGPPSHSVGALEPFCSTPGDLTPPPLPLMPSDEQ